MLIGLSTPAFAQLNDTDTDVVDLREQELIEELVDGEGLDEIVITGSRAVRADLDTAFPTLVVGQDIIEKNAFTNIADALTQVPAFGGGIDPSGDQGANIGVNFVDFLDLGTQRTLTLVNGRRFISSNVALQGGAGQQVDLNVIPVSLIERIETIGVGGAPTYGSDAIAGTINLILRDDYEGLEGTVQFGESDRGDAFTQQYSLLAGANSEDGRGNVTFNIEYTKNDGLLQSDRPEVYIDEPFLSRVPEGTAGFNNIPVPAGTGADGTILDRNGETVTIDANGDGFIDRPFRAFNLNGGNGQSVQLFTNGGIISPSSFVIPSIGAGQFGGVLYGFNPDGSLGVLEAGQSIPGTSLFFAQGGFQNDFFGNVDQIVSPLERINFGSTFRYDITDRVQFKGDVQIANTNADESVEQGGFQTFAFGGTSGALEFSVDNPLLTDAARNTLINEIGLAPDGTFFLSRFNNDLLDGGRRTSETSLWRISAGVNGDFDLGARNFRWDVNAIAGQSDVEIQNTLLNNRRFLNAIDVVVDPVTGQPACRVTVDGQPDLSGNGVSETSTDVTQCVPLNLFGEGVASPAAIDYVTQRGITTSDIEQEIFSATLGGDIVELPAGWSQIIVGYEARNESALFATGGAVEVGLGRGAAIPDTGGKFSTNEFFGELYLPLVSSEMEIPFVRSLEAGGQVREISNSIAGDFTAWTIEGTYKPFQDLTLKGNRTRSLRAPALAELFLPVVTSFQFADDPCDSRFINDGPNRAANCAAVGVTQPFTSNVVNATAQGSTGGNPNLTNEVADGWTLGATVQPRWVPGLTFQADYINIEIEDQIGTFTLENNLETCFDAAPGDFPNNACGAFTRNAAGQIVDFQAGLLNADSADYEFLNFRLDYEFDLVDAFNLFGGNNVSDYGQFGIDMSAFHVLTRDLILANVQQDNTIGSFADPRWSGTADFTWTKGGLRLFWRTLWQDRSLFSASGTTFFADENDELVNSLPGNFVHNASIAYDFSELLPDYDKPVLVQFNVTNVFDDKPGRGLRRQFNDFYQSELIGRQYSVRLRASF